MSYSVSKSYLLAGIILALAGFIYFEAERIPAVTTDLSVVGAAFVPRVIALLLAILALVVVWQGRGNTSDRISIRPTPAFVKAAMFFGIIALYVVALPFAKFELSSITFLMLTMWLLGLRRKVSLIGVPISVTVIVYLIFVKLMYVPIPSLLGAF